MARVWARASKFVWNLTGHGLKHRIGVRFSYGKTIARNSSILINRLRKDLGLIACCGVLIGGGEKNQNFEDEVIHHITTAKLAAIDSNYVKAHDVLLNTLNISRNVNYFEGILCVYNTLVTVAKRAGKYDEAERYIKDVIGYLLQQGIPDDDNVVVNFRLKLSRLYQKRGNREAADSEFNNCLTIQKQSVTYRGDEETRVLLAMILYWYGKCLFENKKFEESKRLLEDCHLVLRKLPFQLPNQTMVVLYSLGEVCHVLGEFDDALRYFNDASAIGDNERGQECEQFWRETKTWLKSRYRTLTGDVTKPRKAFDLTQIFRLKNY